MYMQLNEQFIVDEHGSKQAVIIPFANYLKIIDIIRQYDKPISHQQTTNIWQTNKGSPQSVKAWLASSRYQDYPTGNHEKIEQTIQEIRNAWSDE